MSAFHVEEAMQHVDVGSYRHLWGIESTARPSGRQAEPCSTVAVATLHTIPESKACLEMLCTVKQVLMITDVQSRISKARPARSAVGVAVPTHKEG